MISWIKLIALAENKIVENNLLKSIKIANCDCRKWTLFFKRSTDRFYGGEFQKV